MLYDPKWEQQKTLSLDGLIAWLEQQPAEGTYRFDCQTGFCLLDQYITATTGKASTPSPLHWRICGGGAAYTYIGCGAPSGGPQTFGAALERARAVVDVRRKVPGSQ
jgi:hypothetical protein